MTTGFCFKLYRSPAQFTEFSFGGLLVKEKKNERKKEKDGRSTGLPPRNYVRNL